MMDKSNDRLDWLRLAGDQWLANARGGFVEVYGEADDDFCGLLDKVMDYWEYVQMPERITVNVALCGSGAAQSWHVARRLAFGNVTTYANYSAGSAGLWLFMAGDRRICKPRTEFLYHGNLYRWMKTGPSDEQRAQWMAERTTQDFDFWFGWAQHNGPFEFDAGHALELGVATELAE